MFSRFSQRAFNFGRAHLSARAFSAAALKPMNSRLLSASAAVSAVSAAAVGAAYSWNEAQTVECAFSNKLPLEGVAGTNTERTFIAIKPDGVQRQLIGKIISRFEEKGFTLVAMKLIVPTEAEAAGHYDDLKKKPFFPSLTKFFSSGPIVAMVWQGKGSILTGRKLLGETDPKASPPGSIRGDYSIDIGRNIIHGSDGPEGAAHEINFWFKANEVYDWQSCSGSWLYEKP